jgi:hypothetical protein
MYGYVASQELRVGHLAVGLDRMLREELHAEVLDCNGGLVRGAGLSEPEPDVALGLVRDLQGTLLSTEGARALTVALSVVVHPRVPDTVPGASPSDHVSHEHRPSDATPTADPVSKFVSETSLQTIPLDWNTYREKPIYLHV